MQQNNNNPMQQQQQQQQGNNNTQQIQFSQQQLQMIRNNGTGVSVQGQNSGNFNQNILGNALGVGVGNGLGVTGGRGLQQQQQQQMFLFPQQINMNNMNNNQQLQQQQQQQGQSPNLIPNQMQISNSPNMMNNLMGGLANGMGNSNMQNMAMNAQKLGLNPHQHQLHMQMLNKNQATAPSSSSASPQAIAQMLQGYNANNANSTQQQLYLAQQQQLMQQNILMNPQQLANHQQNQLLFSNNNQQISNGNSPHMQPQQMNHLFVRNMATSIAGNKTNQQQVKPNFNQQPQNQSASPNIVAQQLYQQLQPGAGHQLNSQVQGAITNTGNIAINPNMVNMTMMQQQRSNNPVNNVRPRPQPEAIRPQQHPNMQQQQQLPQQRQQHPLQQQQQQQQQQQIMNQQQQQQQQQQLNQQPPQQVIPPEQIQKTPLFAVCPQQASRIFSLTPFHGLIDMQAAINGGYNPGSATNLDGNSVSGSIILGGTPGHSAQNIVKGLQDINGMRFKEGNGKFDDGSRPGKRKLTSLLEELDVDCVLDPDAERCLLRFADDFLNQVIMNSAKIAKHTQSSTIQVKDIQLELEHNWNIRIPGFEGGITETSTAPKKSLAAAQLSALSSHSQANAHNTRLIALAKAKRETMLKNGIAFMEQEREAAEMVSAFELTKSGDGDDIEEEVVDVVEVEDDEDDQEGEAGDEMDGNTGNEVRDEVVGENEESTEFGTPNEIIAIDSPLIES